MNHGDFLDSWGTEKISFHNIKPVANPYNIHEFRKQCELIHETIEKTQSEIQTETSIPEKQELFKEYLRLLHPYELVRMVSKTQVHHENHDKLCELDVRFDLLPKMDTDQATQKSRNEKNEKTVPYPILFLNENSGGMIDRVGKHFLQQQKQIAKTLFTMGVQSIPQVDWIGYNLVCPSQKTLDPIISHKTKGIEVVEVQPQKPIDSEKENVSNQKIVQPSIQKQAVPSNIHVKETSRHVSTQKDNPIFRPSSPSMDIVREFEMSTTVQIAAQDPNHSYFTFEQGGTLGTTMRLPENYGSIVIGGDQENGTENPDFFIPHSFRPSSPTLAEYNASRNNSPSKDSVCRMDMDTRSPSKSDIEVSLIKHSPPKEMYSKRLLYESHSDIFSGPIQDQSSFSAVYSLLHTTDTEKDTSRDKFDNGTLSNLYESDTLCVSSRVGNDIISNESDLQESMYDKEGHLSVQNILHKINK